VVSLTCMPIQILSSITLIIMGFCVSKKVISYDFKYKGGEKNDKK